MESYKQNYLSRIITTFTVLLFAMGLIMNVLFCGTYNFYELSDWTIAAESWTSLEGIEASREVANSAGFAVMAAIPKGFCLPLFSGIVLLHFFLNSFIALPDEPTLINQKIRLDN